MIKNISIIGGGEIGQAIAYIASGSDINNLIWDKDPKKSSALSFEECLKKAEVVFFCVPSWALRECLASIAPVLQPNIPIVFVSKGLEKDTGLTAPEIAEEFLSSDRIVFMGGPMIAEEIMTDKGGCAVLGGHQTAVSIVAKIFNSRSVYSEITTDAFSVAILGVLKNMYAIVMGAAEGAGYGDNIKSFLFSKIMREMELARIALKGKENAVSPAGVGDLLATSISRGSHHRQTGYYLALRKPLVNQSEGAASISALITRITNVLSVSDFKKLSILSFAKLIIDEGAINQENWHKILND